MYYFSSLKSKRDVKKKNFHEIRTHAWGVKTGAVFVNFLVLIYIQERRYTSKYHRVLFFFSPQKTQSHIFFFRLLNKSSCGTYARFPLNYSCMVSINRENTVLSKSDHICLFSYLLTT